MADDILVEMINVGDRYRQNYGDIEELKESIEKHGVIQPITICISLDTPSSYDLVAGGRRLEATRMAGLKTIPAVVREIAGEEDLREIELVENIQRKDLDWPERCLLEERIVELKGSQSAAADTLDHSVGLTNRHVQMAQAMKMIPELSQCKNIAEAERQLKKFEESVLVEALKRKADDSLDLQHDVTITGDARKDARLAKRLEDISYFYNIGDALEGMRNIPEGRQFHFAEVDPPYGIDLADQKRTSSTTNINRTDGYTEVSEDTYHDWTVSIAKEVYRHLEHGAYCVWWFAPTMAEEVRTALIEAEFEVDGIPAIWVKPNGQTQQPHLHLARCYEPFYIARKGKATLKKAGRGNVFAFNPVSPNKKVHPTERPIELIQEILDTFSYPGYKVLCPFLGSGKTLISALSRDMHAYGWDLNEEYKDQFLRICVDYFIENEEDGDLKGEEGDVQY